jgi:hypothetical protein
MSHRKMHPDAIWPFVCMIAGALLAVPFVGGDRRWSMYVLPVVGAIAGIVINTLTRKA